MRVALCLMLLCTAYWRPACAQMVDYDAFEQMFGEPVTTSATGKPQRVSDVPADMEIITAKAIEQSGADNIPDVLRSVAGLDVRRYGQVDAAVGIRGNNTALNPRVLVLLDGRQVYEDDYGFTVWPLIPVAMDAIRQIEIIKGPSAALYGFNAVSGVINIITFDPLRDAINAARVQVGTQSQTSGDFVTTWQIPNQLGVRLSGSGFRATEFTGSEGVTIAARMQPHVGTLALDSRAQVASNIEWDLSGSYGSLETGYFVDLGTFSPIEDRANSLRSLLSVDTKMGVIQLDTYRNENIGSFGPFGDTVAFRENVVVAKLSDLLKFGSAHTVRLGAEFRDNEIANPESFNGRLADRIFGASVMWDWQIMPALSWTNALRIDDLFLSHEGKQFEIPTVGALYRDVNLVEPSFNSGIVYKPTPLDTIRLTAARAIQLPSLLDFGVGQSFDNHVVVLAGNPGLAPSVVTNYEMDYDRLVAGQGAILRLAAYLQQSNLTIGSPFGSGTRITNTGNLLLGARNFGGSREAGGEIGLRNAPGASWRWQVSYALAAVHDESSEQVLRTTASISYQRQTPTSSVVASLGKSWRQFDADLQAKWQSHFDDFSFSTATLSQQPVTVANYVTISGRIGYRLNKHLTLSLVAEQLNQQRLMESAGLQVDRRVLAGIKAGF